MTLDGRPAMSIRQFRETDQEQVRDLILSGMRERWGVVDESMNSDLDDIQAAYGTGRFFVAFCNETLVGTGGLVPESDSTIRVVRMWVRTKLRRTGIGTEMLHRLLDVAKRQAYTLAVLETTQTWSDAITFYKKHGFTVESHRDGDVHFYKKLTDET